MKESIWRFGTAAGIIIVSLISGCATTRFGEGKQAMERGDYDEATRFFIESIKGNEQTTEALRELGIVLLEQGKKETAERVLTRAFQRDSTDARTILFLGLAAEDNGHQDRAIAVYRRYLKIGQLRSLRADIEARLDNLLHERLARQAREILAQESMLNSSSQSDSTLAVLYFVNAGKKSGLNPLEKGLTDMLITDLSKVRNLQVVERVRMQKLMEEMKLEPAGMASANVPLRFGRLLGAARVIQGAFIDLTDMQLRISAGLVPVKAQGNMQTSQVNGSIDNLFVMEKDLVFSLIDEMGIRLSQEERDEIARIPTENIMAFMAYCRGLDAEDRGQFQEAANYYSQAVKLDPSFTTAQKPLQRTSSLAGGQSKVMALAVRSRPQSSERGQRSFYARQAHLKHIGDLLNKRFLPGLDTRKATKDENQTDFGDTDRVQLEVRVTLPVQQP